MPGLPQAISPTPRLDSVLASSQGALGQIFCFICRINS